MTEEKTFTLAQAHYQFALEFHRQTWDLLDKPARTPFEEVRMVDYAHASLAHWRSMGTAVRQQRGEWLLSRVYAVLGEGRQALKHAQLCHEVLESNKDEMESFDFAFAYEAIARAYAVSGDRAGALKFIEKAKAAGETIQTTEDRETFLAEFNSGDWQGMK